MCISKDVRSENCDVWEEGTSTKNHVSTVQAETRANSVTSSATSSTLCYPWTTKPEYIRKPAAGCGVRAPMLDLAARMRGAVREKASSECPAQRGDERDSRGGERDGKGEVAGAEHKFTQEERHVVS